VSAFVQQAELAAIGAYDGIINSIVANLERGFLERAPLLWLGAGAARIQLCTSSYSLRLVSVDAR
jgi:hypothetical protein